ncbi:D-alanyl-D-alanine carboxypeptidase family protein [Planktothricoides raciborskii]|uniref:M15 family metallopeptidase n=1 Tax=Planktothricoides raciborskii GIHE-MW2 TaxID=2792601 RepID=A0AAU8JBJ1_9CYAN|nr:D-alanyl-D-alanine carboxypeptidase family protein [Planktothricoides raciborskii]
MDRLCAGVCVLDNPSLSKKSELTSYSAIAGEDIPQAVREPGKKPLVIASESRPKALWAIGGLIVLGAIGAIGAIATSAGVWYVWPGQQNSQEATANSTANSTTNSTSNSTSAVATAASPAADVNASAPQQTENILGHLPYEEAPESELSPITSDGRLKMRQAAAEAFLKMQEAARLDGVELVAISAFRTLEDQDYLFFRMKAERGQGATKRAEVSAPPGYSEHHTGYAVDIGDGNVPATDLSKSFENTPAFKWLEENAPYYSFELSFPENNPQGISYEPWHWRFVGDRHSLETFYRAQTLK